MWPWVAQIGADRGGFYSYQWLENLIGCQVRNAGTIHPDWAARPGGELRLHPKAPALRIVSVEPGRALIAYMAPVPDMQGGGAGTREPPATRDRAPAKNRWMTASWLFFIEPTGPARCRVISRYRCGTSDDLVSRLQFGRAIIEPVGFAMDRRMLIGLKQRAERAAHGAARLPVPSDGGTFASIAPQCRAPDTWPWGYVPEGRNAGQATRYRTGHRRRGDGRLCLFRAPVASALGRDRGGGTRCGRWR